MLIKREIYLRFEDIPSYFSLQLSFSLYFYLCLCLYLCLSFFSPLLIPRHTASDGIFTSWLLSFHSSTFPHLLSLFPSSWVSAVFSLYPLPTTPADSLTLCFSVPSLSGWGLVDVWERVPGDRDNSCDCCSLNAIKSSSLSICFWFKKSALWVYIFL